MKKITLISATIIALNGLISAQSPTAAPAAPKPVEAPSKPVEAKSPVSPTQPADTAKPEAAKPPAPAQDVTPSAAPVSGTKTPIDKDKLPATLPIVPVKPAEPELDEETKRQIEAAKQKILKEKAEREEAERKTLEETAKRQERERTFFGGLIANSKIYAGVNGGYVLSLNNIHAAGFGFGGFAQYQAYEQYGLHIGVETGQYSAKNYKLKSSDYTLALSGNGALGFIAINPAVQYTLPAWLPVELSVALGVSIYTVKGGTYSFKSSVSPYFLVTALYPIFSRLHVGVALDGIIASTSQIQSDGVAYALDISEGLTRLGAQVVVRYQIF